MALFTHLTAEKNVAGVRRAGIRGRRVFCLPAMVPYVVSHQWLREVRRWSGQWTYVAVDFRVPDDQVVLVGHYNGRSGR